MISQAPLSRYFDAMHRWFNEVEASGVFRAFAKQVREVRSAEVLFGSMPYEYMKVMRLIEDSIKHQGFYKGGVDDLNGLRSLEGQFPRKAERLVEDEQTKTFISQLVGDAYALYALPFGFSNIASGPEIVRLEDRYVCTCSTFHRDNDGHNAEAAYFQCEFDLNTLFIISARFEDAKDGRTMGLWPEEAAEQINQEAKRMTELLETWKPSGF